MQSYTFRCSNCHHRCDVHNNNNNNRSFSDLFLTNANNVSSFARVLCPAPACQANLYHCRQCTYNSVLKANFQRHVRLRHPVADTVNEGPPAGDSDNDDYVDFNQSSDWNNDHEMDDFSEGNGNNSMDNGSVHSEDDNMDVDEEEEGYVLKSTRLVQIVIRHVGNNKQTRQIHIPMLLLPILPPVLMPMLQPPYPENCCERIGKVD